MNHPAVHYVATAFAIPVVMFLLAIAIPVFVVVSAFDEMARRRRSADPDACDTCGGSRRVDGGPCVMCKATGRALGSTGDWPMDADDAADAEFDTRRELRRGL